MPLKPDVLSRDAAQMLASTTAALLRSVLALRSLSLGAAVMSIVGIYVGAHGAFATGVLVAVLGLTFPLMYLMFRIEFDAHLFERLSAQQNMNEALTVLDGSLQQLGLVKDISARSLDDRVAGTRRLIMRAVGVLLLQLALLFAAAVVIALH